ncbi:MAG: cell division protein SepF [Ruminococcaceae bacterium]|nr:cell division protein SepF [Oscillospiraceae bacterium]
MAFTDLFKKLINASDDEYDEVTEENTADGFETTSFSSARDYSVDEPKVSSRSRRQATYSNDPSRVVDIRTTAMLQVVLVKPDKFEDARAIADHLNEKRTVVLNLEAASKDVARRLIDLLNGVAYANGGQLKKVSTNTYIITPYNVNVSGDLLDELESTGVFF